MSIARITDLRERVDEDPCEENYKALVGEEMTFLASQKSRVEAAIARHAKEQEKHDELKAKVNAIRGEIEGRKRQMSPAKDAVCTAEDLRDYSTQYLSLLTEFTVRKQTLTHVLSYSAADFRLADLSVVSRWLDTWSPFFSGAEDSCRALKMKERNTPNAVTFLPPTRDLYNVLDEVCRLQLQARSLVGRERYRRSAYSAESIDDFMGNQEQLLSWCHAQYATLSNLTSEEDLREFSSSFHINVPVMDSNFLVLSEQYEVLSENAEVQDAMKEVNEAWIELCLATYEKLREAGRQAHKASGVEDDCADWTRRVLPQVQQLVERVRTLLSSRGEGLSEAADAKRALTRCHAVMKDLEAFQVVCAHLADFDVREECVQPHLDALRRELMSDMTSTVLGFPCAVEYEGRIEYKNRIEELREWIDVKSQKGTYLKLLERLEDTKSMIEEYADALFPEEDDAAE